MHQRGNSLNIHELYAHYQNNTKVGSQRGSTSYNQGGSGSNQAAQRTGNHQGSNHGGNGSNAQHYPIFQGQPGEGNAGHAQNGANGGQLFVPGAMKMQMI
jgi:hypothetical protein